MNNFDKIKAMANSHKLKLLTTYQYKLKFTSQKIQNIMYNNIKLCTGTQLEKHLYK